MNIILLIVIDTGNIKVKRLKPRIFAILCQYISMGWKIASLSKKKAKYGLKIFSILSKSEAIYLPGIIFFTYNTTFVILICRQLFLNKNDFH